MVFDLGLNDGEVGKGRRAGRPKKKDDPLEDMWDWSKPMFNKKKMGIIDEDYFDEEDEDDYLEDYEERDYGKY